MRLLLACSVSFLVLSACGGATETDLLGTPPGGSGKDGSVEDTGPVGKDVNVPPSDGGVIVTGIWCGTDKNQVDVFCTNQTQICCYQKPTATATYACKASGSLSGCQLGTRIGCDDEADCAGKICCGGFLTNAYDEVSCKATCTGVVNGRTQVRFCDPNAAQDECTSLGQSCQASGTLDGYFVCK